MERSYGKLSALFYDMDKPTPPKELLDFFLSYIDLDMRILEPMCGSGRLLVPLAEKGYNIDGFDLSAKMLEKCRTKIKPINKDSILEQCNFLEYKPEKRYHFIFIPSGSFSLIIDDEQIVSYLNHLEMLLEPNGKIVLDLLAGESDNIDDYSNVNKRTVKEGDTEIVLYDNLSEMDKTKNVAKYLLRYELYKNQILMEKEEEELNVKYYRTNEFEGYLRQVGLGESSLKVENKFADYQKTKYISQKTDVLIYELTKC